MAEEATLDKKRLAINLELEERYRIQDVAFLLKVTETELVKNAIAVYTDALIAKKGEDFAKALELMKKAREE